MTDLEKAKLKVGIELMHADPILSRLPNTGPAEPRQTQAEQLEEVFRLWREINNRKSTK